MQCQRTQSSILIYKSKKRQHEPVVQYAISKISACMQASGRIFF